MVRRNQRFRVTAKIDVVVEGGSAEAALERIRQMCIAAKIPIKEMKVKEDQRVPKPKGDPAVTKHRQSALFQEPEPKKAEPRKKNPQLGLGFK